jgi:hypothetical protein
MRNELVPVPAHRKNFHKTPMQLKSIGIERNPFSCHTCMQEYQEAWKGIKTFVGSSASQTTVSFPIGGGCGIGKTEAPQCIGTTRNGPLL